MPRARRPVVAIVVSGILALTLLAACGGGGDKEPTTAPPPPAAAPLPPAATPLPAPAEAPAPAAAPTPVVEPGVTLYDDYGFKLRLEGDVAIEASGWTAAEPDTSQGALRFSFRTANVVLIWVPSEGATPQTRLAQAYNTVQAAQPGVTFAAVSEGETIVSGQPGVYGGFTASGAADTTLGGLIGAWNCPASDRSFSVIVTAPDAATAQLRFQYLLSNFECAS